MDNETLTQIRRNRDRKLSVAIVAATIIVTTGFGVLAYDTTWVGSGKPISAAAMKASLDEIQARLAAVERKGNFIQMTVAGNVCSLSIHQTIPFTSLVSAAGLSPAGNGVTLLAGHRYRVEAVLNTVGNAGSLYLGYQFLANGAPFGDTAYTGSNANYGFHAGLMSVVTPAVDTNVTVYIIDPSLGSGCATTSYGTYLLATEI